MKYKVFVLLFCVFSLLFPVASAHCDVVGDLPKLVFPVEGSQKCQHLEGSSAHVFELSWRGGPRVSELFALDLSSGDVVNGAAVRPIALGVVEYISKGDSNYNDGDYGWVLVRHDQRLITTRSDFVNSHVGRKEMVQRIHAHA